MRVLLVWKTLCTISVLFFVVRKEFWIERFKEGWTPERYYSWTHWSWRSCEPPWWKHASYDYIMLSFFPHLFCVLFIFIKSLGQLDATTQILNHALMQLSSLIYCDSPVGKKFNILLPIAFAFCHWSDQNIYLCNSVCNLYYIFCLYKRTIFIKVNYVNSSNWLIYWIGVRYTEQL